MSEELNTHSMDRRKFIKNSMIAGGGILIAPRFSFAQGSPNDRINVALVGLGVQGRVLLDSMLNIPGLQFRAVCDIWEYSRTYGERKLKKEGYEVNAYENIEDMLAQEKGLDVAIVATPDLWHARHTNLCLKAGLHVYCEKMMARTVEEARSMVVTARETGKLCQIGHQRRSNPRYIHAYENLIKKAKIPGRITNLNGQWNRAVTPDIGWPKKYAIPDETLKRYGYEDMHQFRNWRWFKELSGGPISDLGAHQIDIYNWFLDAQPKSVFASGGADYYPNREWYDNVMVIYEYDTAYGPVRAFYQTLTTTSAGGGYWEYFMGDEGAIKMSENPSLSKIFREERAPDWKKWEDLMYLKQTEAPAPKEDGKIDVRETAPLAAFDIPVVLDKPPHQPHLENFFGAVRGKGKLNADVEHSFKSEVGIFRVNEAVAASSVLTFDKSDFEV
ncbi:Gfo/Idh/MocA family oxidoreductase [Pelagicoccus sp. SDUM812003]|uniref:Gfo/Idh/MocA family protein n=1 Tax=Pelagicoccus sp. SDUM812003 TaxID=3041267 RepID=UPI00280D457B|nr:Gfo/Idh/MocA family oxidoreductase [Pelagicoccus sp. SDUM812003]MDQ8201608.1 Gfo/Idh/MocA family oxidoreductase [Pelagicoccus sp. SDUM812003]